MAKKEAVKITQVENIERKRQREREYKQNTTKM